MTATLGVEEEFHLVDPWTGEVRGGAAQVLAALPDGDRYKPELMMSAVETNSSVCANLLDLRADVTAATAAVIAAAPRLGSAVMAAGAAALVGTTPIGITPNDRNANEYDALVRALCDSGVAHDPGMSYFDTLPASTVPTIEIRIADSVPLLDDLVLIAGLGRGHVLRCMADEIAGAPDSAVPVELLVAARWRAARSGLSGDLLHPRTSRPVDATDAVQALLEFVRAQTHFFGDSGDLTVLAQACIADGGSAQRQRQAVAETGEVRSAVDLLCSETAGNGREARGGALDLSAGSAAHERI